MKLHIFIITALIITAQLYATEPESGPDKSGLTGKVADRLSKKPIEYATVALFRESDSSLVAGCITDKDGLFSLSKVEEGNYRLEIRFVGYKTLSLGNIKVKKSLHTGELLLEPDVSDLEGVEITAERSPVEYKIDKQVINASSNVTAMNGSAIDVLKQSPSITVDNEDNVSLRGSGDFMLLINNKLVVSNRTDILKQIPASQIENIEIMTNPSSKYDAGGASGIINIRTKKLTGESLSGMLNARAGYTDKYNGDFIFKKGIGKFRFQVAGTGHSSDNFSSSTNLITSSDAEIQSSIYNEVSRKRKRTSADIHPEMEVRFNDKTSLTAGFSWMHFGFHSFINTDYTRSINQITSTSLAKDDFFLGAHQLQSDFSFRHEYDTNGRALDISGFFLRWVGINDQDTKQYATAPDNTVQNLLSDRKYYEDHFMHQGEIKADYKHPFKNGILAETGVQSNYRFFEADKSMTGLDTANGLWHEEGIYSGVSDFSEGMHAAYVQLSGNTGPWGLQGGLRTQYYMRKTDIPEQNMFIDYKHLYFFPSLNLSRQGKNNSQWQMSYSRRINLPNDWFTSPVPYYNDGYIIQTGKPDLKPELFDAAEINHIRYIKQHMLSLSVFTRVSHNAVERVMSKDTNGVYTIWHDNLSEKYYYGFEGGSNIKLNKKMNLNVSASIYGIEAYVKKAVVPYTYSDMSFNARFTLQFRPVAGTAFELNGSYDGAERESNGKRDPLYAFNLSFRQGFLKNKLNLTVSANDIFHTWKYRYTEINDSFKTTLDFRGEYPVVYLGLSYKINDFKPSRPQQQNNTVPAMGM